MSHAPFPTYSFSTNAEILREQFPDVSDACRAVRKTIREHGPIPPKYRELMMLSAFAAVGIDSGFKIHTKIAVEEGATRTEIEQAVLIGLCAAQPLAPTVEALKWIREALDDPS